MANISGFNANEVEPNVAFDALPADWYEAIIVESEMKPTKAQDGHYLELKLQVVGGKYNGRNVWDRLNLDNTNDLAVQIAKGTLSAICRAVNVTTPKDSTELHNLPLLVKVAQKPYEGEMRNEIKGYKPKNGAAAATPTASNPTLSQAAPPAPKAGAGDAPWLKKAAK